MTDSGRVDRTAFAVATSHEAAAEADRRYWWSRSPEERRRAVETLRHRNYGADAASGRVERTLEITRRGVVSE